MSYPGRTEPTPEIAVFTLGPFATNCYVVSPPKSTTLGDHPCWIIDAGVDPRRLLKHIRDRQLQPQAVILTHAHADHIAGLGEVLDEYPRLSVHIHPDEASWLGDPVLNLSASLGVPVVMRGPTHLLEDGQVVTLGSTTWRIAHTPGHSPGGITLIDEASRTAIVGDALFAGSVGRTDFPGSSMDVLTKSIRERLYALPDDTRVLPGHGPETTIGREKRSNPYVRG